MSNLFLQEAKALAPYLQEMFFQLHKNPEMGRQEYKTQALILAELEKLGIEAEPIADTGVVGIIRGGKPGKTVGFRADIDALPIQEEADIPYKSQVPGVMHACGHDAHVTVLLGAAKILAARKESLRGNVKLLFQPNEEGDGGAERMVQAGCMENPHVDAVFCGHITHRATTGTIYLGSGPRSAASNPFTVIFRGKGTHGAQPHTGTDTIVAACQVVTALQTISSRRTNPTDSVLVTVGAISGGVIGTGGSIIPETVRIDGIMRTQTPEIRARAKEDFRQIVTGISEAMGVKAEIDMREGYAATINDDAMTEAVRIAAGKVLGEENIIASPKGSMGAEDFGYFSQEAPGCYYTFGVQKPGTEIWPIHNSKFVADLDALPYGTALYAQIADDFLK